MSRIESIVDLLEYVRIFYEYLSGKISFNENGFPVFSRSHFLDEWPDQMVSYQNRKNKLIVDPKRTVVCFFCDDGCNYSKFRKVFSELEEYRKYMGIVSPDITITKDMDIELQKTIMLANQLFIAVLAVNGIKIVFNTRSGIKDSETCFSEVPRDVMCASGFLGCANSHSLMDSSDYMEKILGLLPGKLLIYGKEDPVVESQLELMGISFRRYEDFHTFSKRGA